jgi:hypothetical protein
MACAMSAITVLSGSTCRTPSAQARRSAVQACKPWSLRRPLMAIPMGLDQHRAQITTDWVDTSTGEVSRARVAPADRAGVRRFLARFRGEALEVAWEATTGWRFVVEELHRIGAIVHLAEPADTAALRGHKRRAKNDRADARHLRELLMAGRVPESWIAPAHALRTLGRAWCRIVWQCWEDGVPYDPARHRALQRHVTVIIPTPSGPRPDTAATERMAGAAVTRRAGRRTERAALDGKPAAAKPTARRVKRHRWLMSCRAGAAVVRTAPPSAGRRSAALRPELQS